MFVRVLLGMETFSRLCFQFISEHRNWLCLSFLETWLLQGSPKVEVLQELERACEVFSSLGFVKSFLSLTQLAALPKACLEALSAKAYLRSSSRAVGKLVRPLQAGPVVTLRTHLAVLSPMALCTWVPLHVRLGVHPSARLTLGADPVAVPSCSCPSVLGWIASSTSSSAKGCNCVCPCCLER